MYMYTFYCQYSMDWIANMEIGLDPNNNVIKKICICKLKFEVQFEPRSEKTGLRGFRLGQTQTGLCSHRR